MYDLVETAAEHIDEEFVGAAFAIPAKFIDIVHGSSHVVAFVDIVERFLHGFAIASEEFTLEEETVTQRDSVADVGHGSTEETGLNRTFGFLGFCGGSGFLSNRCGFSDRFFCYGFWFGSRFNNGFWFGCGRFFGSVFVISEDEFDFHFGFVHRFSHRAILKFLEAAAEEGYLSNQLRIGLLGNFNLTLEYFHAGRLLLDVLGYFKQCIFHKLTN